MDLQIEYIRARDLPDAWFQCIYNILEKGYEYTIDRGSFQGQKRLEYDCGTDSVSLDPTSHSGYPTRSRCPSSHRYGVR